MYTYILNYNLLYLHYETSKNMITEVSLTFYPVLGYILKLPTHSHIKLKTAYV